MEILVYKGKYGDVYFDASESQLFAFFAMFKFIDSLNYYGKSWMPPDHWILVKKARAGDKLAALDLLKKRRAHEYEEWMIESVIMPNGD